MPSWDAAGIRLYVLDTECQYSTKRSMTRLGRLLRTQASALPRNREPMPSCEHLPHGEDGTIGTPSVALFHGIVKSEL
jgi:hypothetical protein